MSCSSFHEQLTSHVFVDLGLSDFNETWDISPVIEAYGVCSVNIYDKTGNLVYESASYDNLWSGTFGGGVLPSGVYYYSITANNGDYSTNGSINLLK